MHQCELYDCACMCGLPWTAHHHIRFSFSCLSFSLPFCKVMKGKGRFRMHNFRWPSLPWVYSTFTSVFPHCFLNLLHFQSDEAFNLQWESAVASRATTQQHTSSPETINSVAEYGIYGSMKTYDALHEAWQRKSNRSRLDRSILS